MTHWAIGTVTPWMVLVAGVDGADRDVVEVDDDDELLASLHDASSPPVPSRPPAARRRRRERGDPST